jgi:hypothetical protein
MQRTRAEENWTKLVVNWRCLPEKCDCVQTTNSCTLFYIHIKVVNHTQSYVTRVSFIPDIEENICFFVTLQGRIIRLWERGVNDNGN